MDEWRINNGKRRKNEGNEGALQGGPMKACEVVTIIIIIIIITLHLWNQILDFTNHTSTSPSHQHILALQYFNIIPPLHQDRNVIYSICAAASRILCRRLSPTTFPFLFNCLTKNKAQFAGTFPTFFPATSLTLVNCSVVDPCGYMPQLYAVQVKYPQQRGPWQAYNLDPYHHSSQSTSPHDVKKSSYDAIQ